jgi:hypothetical protein
MRNKEAALKLGLQILNTPHRLILPEMTVTSAARRSFTSKRTLDGVLYDISIQTIETSS